MTIRVDAGLFRAAYEAVSDDAIRIYLGGVRIEPHPAGGALLVATDGHVLVVLHDAAGECDAPVTVKLSKPLLKVAGKEPDGRLMRRRLAIDQAAKTATVEDHHGAGDGRPASPLGSAHDVIVDGTFPDWRAVVKKAGQGTPGTICAFGHKPMRTLCRISRRLLRDTSIWSEKGGMLFESNGTDELVATMVRWVGVDNALALIMPRKGRRQVGLPAFLAGPETPAKAA